MHKKSEELSLSRLAIAIQLALVAGASGSAVAETPAAAATLPSVTVSTDWLGAPTPAAAAKHPGARTVLTQEVLADSANRTLEDVLRPVSGLTVTDESGTGVLPNVGVRGLSPLRSEQVLLLQDGMPMTLAPYGQTGASLFPLTLPMVETVDVARGGVAVHYGPNNVGGVVNFLTRRIPAKPSVTLKESVSIARTGRVLNDTYVRAGGFVGERLGLQVQANVIGGEAERAHSGTSIGNLMVDTEWFPTDRDEVRAGLQRYVGQNELPGALTPQTYERDRTQSTRPLDRFDADTTRGHLSYTRRFDGDTVFNWKNFGHRSTRTFAWGSSTNADTASTQRKTSPREFRVWGTEPSVSFNIDGAIKQKIMLGARYMREEVDYKVDTTTLSSGAYVVDRNWRFENDAYAYYLSDTFSLLDGRLKVTPGGRFEDVRLAYRNNATGAQTADTTLDWLPGLDVGFQARPDLFLFANTHRSLRPVQFTQIIYANSDLTAERAENHEVGARWAASPNVDVGLTAFQFQFDNKLEFVNSTVGFRNLGKARHQGAELDLKWRPAALRGLELGAAYTQTQTEQQSGASSGKELPYAPREQLALNARYRGNGWTWNLNGQFQSTMFSDSANTEAENATGSVGQMPAYWLWNASVGHAFQWNGTRMKAGLGINNLFDRDYYFRGVDFTTGRMPQPGRSVLLSLQADL